MAGLLYFLELQRERPLDKLLQQILPGNVMGTVEIFARNHYILT